MRSEGGEVRVRASPYGESVLAPPSCTALRSFSDASPKASGVPPSLVLCSPSTSSSASSAAGWAVSSSAMIAETRFWAGSINSSSAGTKAAPISLRLHML